ncbi:hypothetical protein SU69_01205 [Thermosipho melanesiensis]|uniref:Uncharacterized protein n=2 Tax=Thermosipho melanesiensis TaxID=46541 RepID=A6LJJ9_THEM4|nr:hypothetical protein [Thermosipho melanesiensis]ABR30100.1 hypothetical protein Tmel_0226 [Thermosipho melanesiensis BI429]APT73297.1 hypothetical protein BW47_01245 [Thermosipho melanesiensis]OOC38688.1 hypothetical protein SU68_01205 [Thermosipho melanesiensis]OOC40492.1 hypothetical protein SU70_01205 [Thermosipho melanesiensis]OOC40757.1 hypothetical protein SU69_01205 [Thermosipho melanesiensis]
MKKWTLIILFISIVSFAFEIYGGWNFTIDGTSSFYSVSVDLPISVNNDTEFGFSFQYLHDNFTFTNYGKYSRETSFGKFVIYGKGGALFQFSFDSIGYMVLAGIRYYFNNFFLSFSYSVLYIGNDKIQAIPVEFGYHF